MSKTTPATPQLTPLRAAWIAAGSPTLGGPEDVSGNCARCGTSGANVPVRSVLSRSFTTFDDWLAPSEPALCAACTWGYRTTDLRSNLMQITRDPPTAGFVANAALRGLLSSSLAEDVAVTIPSRPGRKHVLPHALWGTVTLDDLPLPWSRGDGERLRIVEDLRGRGAPASTLQESTPPWRMVAMTDPAARADLLTAWAALDPWRRSKPWMTVAVLVTRP